MKTSAYIQKYDQTKLFDVIYYPDPNRQKECRDSTLPFTSEAGWSNYIKYLDDNGEISKESSFFRRKKEVLALRGGSSLTYANHCLYDATAGCSVAMLSSRMQQTLAEWREKGYEVQSANTRFIVAWKPKDAPKEEKEAAVILADLHLIKHH